MNIFPLVVEYREEYPEIQNEENDVMMKVLKKYFPHKTLIPYDMDERKKVFAKAFDELAKYM